MGYSTIFKTPLGILPYKVVYGRQCHLSVELQHGAWWVIGILNLDLNATNEERKMSLNELEKIRRETYDNTRLSKERESRDIS